MGQVTTLFVRKVLAQVDGDERFVDGLLTAAGLGGVQRVMSTPTVSDTAYYALLERIAAADADATSLPLRTGASMRCDDYGAFGLAWKTARNLRGSYDRAERYARALTTVSTYEVEPCEEGAYMLLHRHGERRLGLRLSNEATIASIMSISREVSERDFAPLAVHFRHGAPRDMSRHEAYFGCPVLFDSDRDALLVSHQSLSARNRLGDDAISRFVQLHLERELSELEPRSTLRDSVRSCIARSLSEGVPSVSAIAAELRMTARTLQRRLSSEEVTFQGLIDQARCDLSERLLRDTRYSLAEVAFLTGFSEQSAFNRAFKRWAGRTPREFRSQFTG